LVKNIELIFILVQSLQISNEESNSIEVRDNSVKRNEDLVKRINEFSKENSKDLSKRELKSVSSLKSIRSNSENSDKSKKSCESLLFLTKRSSSSDGSLETRNQFHLQKFDKRLRNKNNPKL
jgi:hypothetical protein